jgi:hypothetical protein
MYSPHLLGPSTASKQRTWEGNKINWCMVLSRGVVQVEVMPAEWKLDGDGLALFVERLPGVLRKMLGREARLHRNVFTDRETGMYILTGLVFAKYNLAIDANDFNLYWGNDAQRQSPDMGDILLHETAVSWFRSFMNDEKPIVPSWEETLVQWTQRARRLTRAINRDYNVAGLCREFPQRFADVVERQRDRLPK